VNRAKPCATCPYLRATKRGLWSDEEYANLQAQDRNDFGSLFGCHSDAKKPEAERSLCVGWALDQKRRNIPSLSLRVLLLTRAGLGEWLGGLSEKGLRLYRSIGAMRRANFPESER
jgi:hypothetical protein